MHHSIILVKERLPANFCCKNRRANAQAYDLIAETPETYASGGMALHVMRTTTMLSAAAVDICRANQGDRSVQTRKVDPDCSGCVHEKNGEGL